VIARPGALGILSEFSAGKKAKKKYYFIRHIKLAEACISEVCDYVSWPE